MFHAQSQFVSRGAIIAPIALARVTNSVLIRRYLLFKNLFHLRLSWDFWADYYPRARAAKMLMDVERRALGGSCEILTYGVIPLNSLTCAAPFAASCRFSLETEFPFFFLAALFCNDAAFFFFKKARRDFAHVWMSRVK